MGYWGCSGPVSAVSLLLLSHSSAGSETEVHFVRKPLRCFKKKEETRPPGAFGRCPSALRQRGKGKRRAHRELEAQVLGFL